MGFQLTITKGKGHGKSFQFEKPEVRIGRLPDNDLVLYDTGVSRYHCEIISDDGAFTLRDTGSSNGTRLNEAITTEGRIVDGDEIGVGPITFVFKPTENAAAGKRRLNTGEAVVSRPVDETRRRAIEEDRTTAFRAEELPPLEELGGPDTGVDRVEVARTETGSFQSLNEKKRGFRNLPRSTRLALVAATALVVGAVVVSAYIIQSSPPPDRSAEIFDVGGNVSALKFGAGPVEVSTPDRANFRFAYGGGRVTVSFAAGGIDSDQELEVLINGKSVGFVEKTPRWQKGLSMKIPRALLAPGQNVLTFDNTSTPEKVERWGITQVLVHQEPLPDPDPEKAKQLFELGKGAYDTRTVAPHNLYKSIEYFEEALLAIEALDEPPPVQAEIRAALTKSESELLRIHNEHLFTAQKSSRFGDNAQAADTLRNLLRYYPDPDDRRHVEVKKHLGALRGEH